MFAREFRLGGPQRQRLLHAQLPQRLARLCRRGQRLRDGWDVNTLVLLDDDAHFLAAASRELELPKLAEALDALGAAIAPLLDPPRLPDAAAAALFAARIEALARQDLHDSAVLDASALLVLEMPTHEDGFPLHVTPPPQYWKRFAPEPLAIAAEAAPPQSDDEADAQACIRIERIADGGGHVDGHEIGEGKPPVVTPAATVETDTGLVERLRAALDRDDLQLLFQPIVPLHGEAQEQFQVLLRLRGSDGTLHTAAELIPAAERGGLIGAIDRWVLERCVALIAQRVQAGHATRLFISQSLHSVRNAWAATHVERLLGEYRIAGQTISLELRADEADLALADVARYANAVKALGSGFVLSGFEAGTTGERLLAALPFDTVRLSARHLQLADAAAREELRELVERLHEHGCRVIAPRVEDARVASALWSSGVDYVQGNFVQPADGDLGFDFRGSVM